MSSSPIANTALVSALMQFILTSVVIFFDPGSALQVAFALQVSAWFHVAHGVWQPFKSVDVRAYWLQHGSLFVTTFILVCGLLFKVAADNEAAADAVTAAASLASASTAAGETVSNVAASDVVIGLGTVVILVCAAWALAAVVVTGLEIRNRLHEFAVRNRADLKKRLRYPMRRSESSLLNTLYRKMGLRRGTEADRGADDGGGAPAARISVGDAAGKAIDGSSVRSLVAGGSAIATVVEEPPSASVAAHDDSDDDNDDDLLATSSSSDDDVRGATHSGARGGAVELSSMRRRTTAAVTAAFSARGSSRSVRGSPGNGTGGAEDAKVAAPSPFQVANPMFQGSGGGANSGSSGRTSRRDLGPAGTRASVVGSPAALASSAATRTPGDRRVSAAPAAAKTRPANSGRRGTQTARGGAPRARMSRSSVARHGGRARRPSRSPGAASAEASKGASSGVGL